jgi:hypothetical protein
MRCALEIAFVLLALGSALADESFAARFKPAEGAARLEMIVCERDKNVECGGGNE